MEEVVGPEAWAAPAGDVNPLNEVKFGLVAQPWAELKTAVFRGEMWPHRGDWDASPWLTGSSSSPWSFANLVIDLRVPSRSEYRKRTKTILETCSFLFQVPLGRGVGDDYLRGLNRLELRVPAGPEQGIRGWTEQEAKKPGGWDAVQQRIFPLVVFARSDGRESRLVPTGNDDAE